MLSFVDNHKECIAEDFTKVLTAFQEKLSFNDRYASFDYCYNFFYRNRGEALVDNMESSCVTLGFYLASWGMFRGSSFLLEKSARHFVPLIEYIASCPSYYWGLDVDAYSEENIDLLVDLYNEVKTLLVPERKAHLTLVTKVMLGVFGTVPAYDRYFIQTFGKLYNGCCGFRSFNKKSLNCIREFYSQNQCAVDSVMINTETLSFTTCKESGVNYTRAKLIDMYGFTKGLEESRSAS